MKAKNRFDIETLRELAGERSFARGQEYYRDGSVQILSLGSKRVVAEVSGTEDYRTVLTGRGVEIDGDCSGDADRLSRDGCADRPDRWRLAGGNPDHGIVLGRCNHHHIRRAAIAGDRRIHVAARIRGRRLGTFPGNWIISAAITHRTLKETK